MKDFRMSKISKICVLVLSIFFLIISGCSKPKGQSRSEAQKYFEQAIDYYQREYFANAKELFKEVISIENDLNFEENYGEANLYLGLISFREEDYESALKHNLYAKDFFKLKFKRKDEGISENNIGNIFSVLGDYDKADEHYRKALLISQLAADKRGEADVLMNIAQVNLEIGNFREAFKYFSKAFDAYDLVGILDGKINASLRMGESQLRFGSLEDAILTFNYAYEIAKENGVVQFDTAILNFIGLANFKLGDYDKALQYFENAFRLTEKSENNPSLKWIIKNNIADIYFQTYQYKQAITEYENAIKIADDYGQGLTSALIKLKLGHAYLNEHSSSETEYLAKAKNIFEELNDFFDNIEFYNGKINSLSGLNKYARLKNDYEEADKILDEIKTLLAENTFRIKNKLTNEFCLSSELFSKMNSTETLFLLSKNDEVFNYDLQIKNNVAQNFIENSPLNIDVKNSYSKLLRQINYLKFEIVNEKAKKSGYGSSKKLDYFEELLDEKLNEFENKQYKKATLMMGTVSINTIKQRLSADQLLVAFFTVKDKINIMLVSKKETQNYLVQISDEVLRGQIKALLNSITNNEIIASHNLLKGLFTKLIKPIENILGKYKHLTFYFSEENETLNFIPFHALVDDSEIYLAERFSIDYFCGFKTDDRIEDTNKNVFVSVQKFKNSVDGVNSSFEFLDKSIDLKKKILTSKYENMIFLSPIYMKINEPASSYFGLSSDSVISTSLDASSLEFSSLHSQNIYALNYYDDLPSSVYTFAQIFPSTNSFLINRIVNDEKLKEKLANDILKQFSGGNKFDAQAFYLQNLGSQSLLWSSIFKYRKI